MSTSYDEAVNYIYDLPKFTTKHTFEEGRAFLDELGAPDRGLRIIHVAGTNGKGSVCAYMESILMHAGMKTGCFISPHLTDCRERVRINGTWCDEEAFADAFARVSEVAKRLYIPTFFEYLFFMAMLIFRDEACEVCILETGLGGRLDATNLVTDKLVSVITQIGYDHCEYLGDTYESIAREKAGIIAQGRPVVYWDDTPGAEVISEVAHSRESVEIALSKSVISDLHKANSGIDFCLRYKYDRFICPHIRTGALYQAENAAIAVCALMQGTEFGEILTEDDLLSGLRGMYWPGRMEQIEDRIYTDGAHNEPAIAAFINSVRCDGATRRLLIFGCMRDKDYHREIGMLASCGLFESAVAVGIDSPRAESADVVAAVFEDAHMSARAAADAAEALDMARTYTGSDGAYAYIAGSLYLVGEMIKIAVPVRHGGSDDRF